MMSWHDVGAVHPSDRVIVVAPARSRHMALTDGEGCPLGLRDYMERPTGIGDIAAHGETADDAAVVVRDLDAQGDLRWKDVIAGFLVHACGGGVRRYAQDDASVVLCGPQVAASLDLQSDAFAPMLGGDRDPLDHAAASFEGLRCLIRPDRRECLGILAVWHDERASYQAVLGPRPYKSRPVQVIRVGSRLWQGFVPAMFDLFGEQVPDRVCLHLVRRRDNPQPGLAFVPLGRSRDEILDAFDETHGSSIPRVVDIGLPPRESVGKRKRPGGRQGHDC